MATELDVERLTERNLGGLRVQTVSERDPTINMLIYGLPGVGKTLLAGSAQDVEEMLPVLFIDIEGGTFSLRQKYPSIDVVRVQTWSQMQTLYDEMFRTDGAGYRTVVLDSLTEIQKFSMYEIMQELARKEPDRDPDIPGMREWGKNTEQIRRFVRAFRDLPINTIFTALVAEDRNARTGLTHKKPSLSGKLSGEVAGFVDVVAMMYTKVVDDEVVRLLLTGQTETEIAKDRSGSLPLVMDNPSMRSIYNLIMRDGETE